MMRIFLDVNVLILSTWTMAECREVSARKFPAKRESLEAFFASLEFERFETPASIDPASHPRSKGPSRACICHPERRRPSHHRRPRPPRNRRATQAPADILPRRLREADIGNHDGPDTHHGVGIVAVTPLHMVSMKNVEAPPSGCKYSNLHPSIIPFK